MNKAQYGTLTHAFPHPAQGLDCTWRMGRNGWWDEDKRRLGRRLQSGLQMVVSRAQNVFLRHHRSCYGKAITYQCVKCSNLVVNLYMISTSLWSSHPKQRFGTNHSFDCTRIAVHNVLFVQYDSPVVKSLNPIKNSHGKKVFFEVTGVSKSCYIGISIPIKYSNFSRFYKKTGSIL